ncbi:MAG: type I-E CRISPR-associated protein Cas5/CasD, partial [Abitibacteriaceae bacterium]|nr:type I-E CRISPR-associated protein Cas5/CasD [Abditibacteriaceae bacterium]
MAKPVLLLRLEGPLQAWGVRSRWDVRDTGLEPSKSGVVGLLGCALGCPMRDPYLEELSNALRFGVRIEHPGLIITDYQTITDYLPTAAGQYKSRGGVKSLDAIRRDGDEPATIISPRSYLEDAAFLVGLEAVAGQDSLLERCALSLQEPVWPIYLGRKACIPTRPICEALTDRYDSLEDALERHPWSWLGANNQTRQSAPPARLDVYVEVPFAVGETTLYQRQDAMRTNAARQYDFRYARHFTTQPTS